MWRPKRKLATPHTTFAMTVDEKEQELFMTIQDDHAVVVYEKDAKDEEEVLRVLQGRRTKLADPHGIALDTKRDEIVVSKLGNQ